MEQRPQPAETAREEVVHEIVARFNRRDLEGLLERYADDAALHEPYVEEPIAGKKALRRFHEELFRAFPDETLEIRQLISSGDWVVARIVASATHSGEFLGMAPTGRRFTVPECTVFEFRGDLVENVWVYVDSGSIARQLGYTFAPAGDAS